MEWRLGGRKQWEKNQRYQTTGRCLKIVLLYMVCTAYVTYDWIVVHKTRHNHFLRYYNPCSLRIRIVVTKCISIRCPVVAHAFEFLEASCNRSSHHSTIQTPFLTLRLGDVRVDRQPILKRGPWHPTNLARVQGLVPRSRGIVHRAKISIIQ
jgi:hypothetical protein